MALRPTPQLVRALQALAVRQPAPAPAPDPAPEPAPAAPAAPAPEPPARRPRRASKADAP